MTQLSLFDRPRTIEVNASLEPGDARRTANQTSQIIELLRNRDATNDELSAISRKYTSRVSDARKRGYDIRVVKRDYDSGLTVYRLFPPDD